MSIAEWEAGLFSHQCFNALLFSQSQNSALLVRSVSAITSQVSWLLEVWASNRNSFTLLPEVWIHSWCDCRRHQP